MLDREKVIKGLEKCKRHECDDCTEKGASQAPWDCPTYDDFVDSALALLKEQKAVKPLREHSGGGTTWWNVCGACRTAINPNDKFCHECGRAVKWE